jgi:hypothetical protein
MRLLVRVLVVALLLSSAVSLSARGRVHAYQAGSGIHRNQPKQHSKKDKQPKKPSPPPAIKTQPLKAGN